LWSHNADTNTGTKTTHDDGPHLFEGDFFNTTPDDLEWPADEEDEVEVVGDDNEDEEIEGEGGVAEQETDWEPPM
jgi:hypothetical protein